MLKYSLTEHDSAQFARLSGDFNPLHVDPIAARRLQFGGTICHGVHLVLKALDLATASGLLKPAHIDTIGSVFGGSVRTGRPVEVELLHEPGSNRLRLAATSEGRAVCTVKLTLADPAPATQQQDGKSPDSNAAAEPSAPLEPDFPSAETLAESSSAVTLGANRALMKQLLPSLAGDSQACELTADLLATTCIVGMKCPGLHSIYSEFKLRRLELEVKSSVTQMTFSVQRADPRFRSVRLAVAGARLVGTLDAFFRAPPVAQPLLSELQTRVDRSHFQGQHALIVGGSRGLGELVVKILVAGGAKVALSYARGKDDAQRIQQEAASSGSQVEILQLDASQPLPEATIRHLETLPLTHLYYFATQQISRNSGAAWNQSLFDGFCQLYVHGFAALVQAATQRSPAGSLLQVLYPSTVFLDQPESGFAEYCAAKAAGESLCAHLALRPGVVVYKPRLPRLQTDQNNSFMGVEGAEPFPVVLQLLQSLQPTRAPLTEPSSIPE